MGLKISVKSKSPEFSFISPRNQYFPLPYSLICYITERPSNSPLGYQKLQKTCKYFFSKEKILLIDSFCYWQNGYLYCPELSYDQTIILNSPNIKYWLIMSLKSEGNPSFSGVNNFLYRCDIKTLNIKNQNIFLDEINLLLDGGKICSLKLLQVNIRDSQGNPVSFDTILAKTPNIRTILYSNKCEIFSSKTFENLNYLKFNKKFGNIFIHIFKVSKKLIDPNLVCKFIQNFCSSSSFCINFSDTFDDLYQENMKNTIKKEKDFIGCFVKIKFGCL